MVIRGTYHPLRMAFILQGATQQQGCDLSVEITRRFTEPQRYSIVLLDFRTQQAGADRDPRGLSTHAAYDPFAPPEGDLAHVRPWGRRVRG
ncbi:hypothetical protein SVIO_059110 [Streptomyces violaceusniger]|uniref:Uncharacterized protein n=1 Tax=Streptomyces violaceusniger TaxID=68280 RepID=A0A4D4L9V5_STRVO|nr:hypothetical protein SVIO_059110 [Streptomyces violaceusniger]